MSCLDYMKVARIEIMGDEVVIRLRSFVQYSWKILLFTEWLHEAIFSLLTIRSLYVFQFSAPM